MNEKQLQEWMTGIERRLDVLEALEGIGYDKQPDTIPAPPVRTTWIMVGKHYRKRYLEARTGAVLDYHPHAHYQAWEDLARLIDGYPEPLQALDDALNGFFSDRWAKAHDYPPTALVKSFGRYLAPPAMEPEDEPDHEAINLRRLKEHRRQEQAELERKFLHDEQHAVKPPSLEELVARVGRKL